MTATDFLLWLQGLRNPALTGFFAAWTFIGSEEFLLVFLALVYWCGNRTLGLRLGLVLLGSQYVNEVLKDWTQVARPGPPLQPLFPETTLGTSSWPSGHAQNTAALAGTLAGLLRRTWVTVLAIIVIGLVGFSRLYLALHWPLDVLSGWVIGGALAALALGLVVAFPRVTVQSLPLWGLIAGLALPLVLLGLHPTGITAEIAGATMGFIGGWALERRFVGFEAPAPLGTQVLKAAIGLAVAFGLRLLLKPVLAAALGSLLGDGVRYMVIVLWIAWLAPALFVRVFGRTVAPTPALAEG